VTAGASPGAGPQHLSIGEVLEELRQEFPDITISKIRFLESQGLIDPERTPSGYRKFYDADVARLRWILHQQKEHFLPLKVIKERLEHVDLDTDPAGAIEREPIPGSNGETGPADSPPTKARARRSRQGHAPPADVRTAESDPDAADLSLRRSIMAGGVSLTRAELARAAGLDEAQVAALEGYGLLVPSAQRDEHVYFDEEALTVAKMAAGFLRHGLEARHLRMYKHFVEREAYLFEQVLLRHLRQRNPEARATAQAELAELARLGRGLRSALLVTAVRDALAE
jgi:DNA-binding transcriptional MerR regulator